MSLSRFDRAPRVLRVFLFVLLAGAFLGAGYLLARMGTRSADQSAPSTPPATYTPQVDLGSPRRMIGAEAPDPAGFLERGAAPARGAPSHDRTAAPELAQRAAPGSGSRPLASTVAAPTAAPQPALPAATAEPPVPPGTPPSSVDQPREASPPAAPTAHDAGAEPDETSEPLGELSTSAVIFVVRHYLPRVRSCYERQLRNDREIGGQVTVRFTIGEGGRVTAAEPVANTTGSDDLAVCVVASLRTWRFPEPIGGPVAFEYPFRFGGQRRLELPGATESQ